MAVVAEERAPTLARVLIECRMRLNATTVPSTICGTVSHHVNDERGCDRDIPP